MRGNKRKKGDRMQSRQTGKNPRMCGGKSALVVAAFQGIPNYFILLLRLVSSKNFPRTEDEISKSALLSLTIKWDIN